MRVPTVIDLFSGAGGLTRGLIDAGYLILCCLDNDPTMINTHKANFPNIPIIEDDIRNVEVGDILDITKDKPELVAGGPPCQGFSTEGRRRFLRTKKIDPLSDYRNYLILEFERIVRELSPPWFLMENVPGFLTLRHGKERFSDLLLKRFRSDGYRVVLWRVNAVDYGVPQTRNRVFVIGTTEDVALREPPATTHHAVHMKTITGEELLPYRTVGESIMDLVGKENQVPSHIPMRHHRNVEARFSYIKEGEQIDPTRVPQKFLRGTRSDFKDNLVKKYSSVYRRLHRQKPSPALVAGHNAFPIHPTLNRSLTVREAARLQIFPDDHIFTGSRQNQCIQVANSVPVLLAEVLGSHLLRLGGIIEFRNELGRWYDLNSRSFPWRQGTLTPFQILVTEVLLRKTQAKNVSRVWSSFLSRIKHPEDVLRHSEKDLLSALRPLGLQNLRAKELMEIAEKYSQVPKTRKGLMSLKGVGSYIAKTTLIFGFDRAEIPIDVNVARLLGRFFGIHVPDDLRRSFRLEEWANAVFPKYDVGEFLWRVLDFAALVCRPKDPDCASCVLNTRCLYYRSQRTKKANLITTEIHRE